MKRADEHIPFLDHLRGVAILAVFLYHCLGAAFYRDQLAWHGWWRDWHVPRSFLTVLPASAGWVGVAIFFVVSGFCIHLSHERSSRPGFGVFFIRRFFRIYPPYLAALVGFACLLPPTRLAAGLIPSRAEQIWSHVFLVHNFFPRVHYAISPAYWSIAVEAQLYLLYPVLYGVARRWGWGIALALTALVEGGMRALAGGWPLRLEGSLPGSFTEWPVFFWFSWTLGAALADAYLQRRPLPGRSRAGWGWAALWIACYFFQPLEIFAFPVAALATASLIACLLSRPAAALPEAGTWAAILRHLRNAGLVSYSAYLIHQPLLACLAWGVRVAWRGAGPPFLVVFGICLLSWPVILALAAVFYRYVEKPSIAWGKAAVARLRPAGAG